MVGNMIVSFWDALFSGVNTQEVQVDQTLPIGRIGNPCSMDHPKDQPLCLVDWTSREYTCIFFVFHLLQFLFSILNSLKNIHVFLYVSSSAIFV